MEFKPRLLKGQLSRYQAGQERYEGRRESADSKGKRFASCVPWDRSYKEIVSR